MRRSEQRWLALLLGVLVIGCSDGAEDEPDSPPTARTAWTAAGPTDTDDGCNPLTRTWDCLLPFPSDFLLVEDESMPSGKRVEIPPAARPATTNGPGMDLLVQYPVDGFSILPQIAVLIPGAVTESGLLGPVADPDASLESSHVTLLLDASTGEAVAHMAEMDPRPEPVDQRAIVLRPLIPLAHERRYVVALQGLKRSDGTAIEAPAGFAALRDGTATGSEATHLAEYFDAHVFPVLKKAGVDRAGLLLAWDFTTGSRQHLSADLLAMRTEVLAGLAKSPPKVTITLVQDAPAAGVARWVEGTVTTPLFLDGEGPGARLIRGDDGLPVADGTTAEVPFAALIPASALARAATLDTAVVQVGHGFFGGRGELSSGSVRELLHRLGAVGVAVDWWGLSLIDSGTVVADIAGAPYQALRFVDRLHQAMANQLVLADAARTAMPKLPAFDLAGSTLSADGPVHYVGSSLGHILGGTYAAIAPRVRRAALGVGGAGFGMIMPRSVSFAQLLGIIDLRAANRLETLKVLLILQHGLDRIDPVVWAPRFRAEPLPGDPTDREILMHVGISDTSVPDMTAHVHARALAIGHLQPAPRPVWGLKKVKAPLEGSAMMEFDFEVPDPAPTARPPQGPNKVHDALRHLEAALSQWAAFLRPNGKVVQTCDGPCNPE